VPPLLAKHRVRCRSVAANDDMERTQPGCHHGSLQRTAHNRHDHLLPEPVHQPGRHQLPVWDALTVQRVEWWSWAVLALVQRRDRSLRLGKLLPSSPRLLVLFLCLLVHLSPASLSLSFGRPRPSISCPPSLLALEQPPPS
jgi:hypothetical protein